MNKYPILLVGWLLPFGAAMPRAYAQTLRAKLIEALKTYCVPPDEAGCSSPYRANYNGTRCVCPSGGRYYNGSSRRCETCGAGTYALPNAAACTNCAAGTASSQTERASACPACFAGTYSLAGAVSCTNCAVGTYSSASNAKSCTSCKAGTYQPYAGQSSCYECPAGKYCTAGRTEPNGSCNTTTYSGTGSKVGNRSYTTKHYEYRCATCKTWFVACLKWNSWSAWTSNINTCYMKVLETVALVGAMSTRKGDIRTVTNSYYNGCGK
jgi:syndecan 4